MLLQEHEGKEWPVLYASRMLVPAECNYSPTEGEVLAMLFALRRFQGML